MNWLRGTLDRLVLLLGVLGSGLLPAFIQQYRQRVSGRLDQVLSDLAPWRQIADRLHGGDLQALIAHHRASQDATFNSEAVVIEQLLADAERLRAAVEAMQGALPTQFWGWLRHLQVADLEATWQLYQPQFPLDSAGLLFALVGGALLWLIWLAVVAGALRLGGRQRRDRRRRLEDLRR